MPPYAEENAATLRERRRISSTTTLANLNGDDGDDDATMVVKTMKELASNEVAVEGVIYSLDNFRHPGGDSIRLFGGNDVTVQYRMMHPHHSGTKFLEKMKAVGKLSDWKPEYTFESAFAQELKQETTKIVKRGKEYGTPGYFTRAAIYISIMVACLIRWITVGPSWVLAIIYGMSQASIGLNVQHDANHGAASRNHRINDILGFGADMIGGSKWTWWQQHTTHHAYTNIESKDPDGIGAEPFILFNNYPREHQGRSFYHNFQLLYFFPALAFYWFSSVLNPQILDLKQRGTLGAQLQWDNEFLIPRRKWAISLRLLYVTLNVLLPFFSATGRAQSPLVTIAQVLTMGFAESLTLAGLFALSHNFEEVDRFPMANPSHVDPKTGLVDWYKLQVETTSTYGSYISGALTGGLNHQIEHHLFPRMSSAWYPTIAPRVREVCAKHNVNYTFYPWIFQNLYATLRYMHRVGIAEDWLKPLEGNN